ncbi:MULTISPECIES: WHG domain-containing protein [unclassified Nocardioides]|uniref:WHG domain-containing protein n=1 Tax=unclassified Nocardioides TaxID=2615069 RepID=UPI00070349B8|nr:MULTISPECIES: WHG domain-containing protein [unclassified Nocardioides]KQZ70568.1 hypothetical protein ASD66_13320 [Nocardioides sp. Root151]KRF16934.1 hypothetical protein ASH02_02430 [Nocardioides sp. Soil796]
MSCSVGSFDTASRLLSTTRGRPGSLKPEVRKNYQRCLTYRGYALSCRHAHVYRATFSWVPPERYTAATARRLAERVCPHHVRRGQYRWSVRGVNPMIITCYSKQQ